MRNRDIRELRTRVSWITSEKNQKNERKRPNSASDERERRFRGQSSRETKSAPLAYERRNRSVPWYHSVSAENRPFAGHARCPSPVTGSPVRVYSSLPASGRFGEFQAAAQGRAETASPAVSHRPTALWRDHPDPCPLQSVCSFGLWTVLYHGAPPLSRVETHKNSRRGGRFSTYNAERNAKR